MNQDQIDSLVRTICKIAGGILAAHGLQSVETVVNSTDVVELISGVVVTAVGIYASHKSNAAPSATVLTTITQPKTNP